MSVNGRLWPTMVHSAWTRVVLVPVGWCSLLKRHHWLLSELVGEWRP